MNKSTQYLKKAIEIAGNQTALAKTLGVHQTTVSSWLNRNRKIPAEYVLVIEKSVGVSRHDLRPDIYPRSD